MQSYHNLKARSPPMSLLPCVSMPGADDTIEIIDLVWLINHFTHFNLVFSPVFLDSTKKVRLSLCMAIDVKSGKVTIGVHWNNLSQHDRIIIAGSMVVLNREGTESTISSQMQGSIIGTGHSCSLFSLFAHPLQAEALKALSTLPLDALRMKFQFHMARNVTHCLSGHAMMQRKSYHNTDLITMHSQDHSIEDKSCSRALAVERSKVIAKWLKGVSSDAMVLFSISKLTWDQFYFLTYHLRDISYQFFKDASQIEDFLWVSIQYKMEPLKTECEKRLCGVPFYLERNAEQNLTLARKHKLTILEKETILCLMALEASKSKRG